MKRAFFAARRKIALRPAVGFGFQIKFAELHGLLHHLPVTLDLQIDRGPRRESGYRQTELVDVLDWVAVDRRDYIADLQTCALSRTSWLNLRDGDTVAVGYPELFRQLGCQLLRQNPKIAAGDFSTLQ